MKYPTKVMIVELECAPFSGAKPAYRWAVRHGIAGLMSDVDTGGKGEVSISRASVEISNIEILLKGEKANGYASAKPQRIVI